jgi:hypothetical protein
MNGIVPMKTHVDIAHPRLFILKKGVTCRKGKNG